MMARDHIHRLALFHSYKLLSLEIFCGLVFAFSIIIYSLRNADFTVSRWKPYLFFLLRHFAHFAKIAITRVCVLRSG